MVYPTVFILAALQTVTAFTKLKPIELEPAVHQQRFVTESIPQPGQPATLATTQGNGWIRRQVRGAPPPVQSRSVVSAWIE